MGSFMIMMRLTCLVLLAFLMGCQSQRVSYDDPEHVEDEEGWLIGGFDPEKECKAVPTRGELVADVELAGRWSVSRGLDYTSIDFKQKQDGTYDVRFMSGGCMGIRILEREASYAGSMVSFNEPVSEYAPAIYTRMYTIRFRDTLYLLASARVTTFESMDPDSEFYEWLLLKRETDTDVDLTRTGSPTESVLPFIAVQRKFR